jgi:hypothetical protein
VKVGEYGRNIIYLYKNGKMRSVEFILRMRRRIKENDGGGEFN